MTSEEYSLAYQKYFKKTIGYLINKGYFNNAEDIAQQAWLRGWEKIHQLEQPEAIFYWICRIAYNYAVRTRNLDAELITDTLNYNPEADYINCVRVKELYSMTDSKDHIFFDLKLRGMTLSEIGSHLGRTKNSVAMEFFRVKMKSKAVLSK